MTHRSFCSRMFSSSPVLYPGTKRNTVIVRDLRRIVKASLDPPLICRERQLAKETDKPDQKIMVIRGYLPSSKDIIHCSTYSLRLNPFFWAIRCNFFQELGVISRLCLVFFSSCKTGISRNLFLPFPVDIPEVIYVLYRARV